MSLIKFIENLQASREFDGFKNYGLVNIESGYLSVQGQWLKSCDCSPSDFGEIQYKCKVCGRTAKNSVTIQAGYGDGVYAVIPFYNRAGATIACALFLDSDSTLASKFMGAAEDNEVASLESLPEVFEVDYPGISLGSIKNDFGQVLFGDQRASIDSEFATVAVDNWIKGDFEAFAFVEDSTDNDVAQFSIEAGMNIEAFNGGLQSSIRPRVVLVVSDSAKDLKKGLADFSLNAKEWKAQVVAWSKQNQVSSVGKSGLKAIYWNGRICNNYAAIAENEGDDAVTDLLLEEFSWYLQGAALGSDECSEAADQMIEESGGEWDDSSVKRDAYVLRGMWSLAKDEN